MRRGAFPSGVLLVAVLLAPSAARAAICDDGDPCTKDFFFIFCVHQPIPGCAACDTDADCADPDNDKCTGIYWCHPDKGVCELALNTVAHCDKSMDSACGKNQCAPATGLCSFVALAGPCNDYDPCTINDTCHAGGDWGGYCAGTQDVGPGKTCECTYQSGCGALEDGDVCNGTLYCDWPAHTCKVNPATVVECNTENDTACSMNTCQPATGVCRMTAVPDQTSCSDGDPCTIKDKCTAGTCGGELDVGPGETCTCRNDADCAPLEDGNLCNGTLFCNKATHECLLNPATVKSCPSAYDTACSQNLCDPSDGLCKVTALSASCDDGNGCTINDTCTGGICQGTLSVGAGAQCACQSNADCMANFDDGNACNGTLYCDLAANLCKVNPATVKEPGVACMASADCPSGFHCAGALQATSESGASIIRAGVCTSCPTVGNSDCAVSTCDPATGACALAPFDDGTDCATDGDPCTSGDHCFNGACVGTIDVGPGLTCECEHDSDCIDDGNRCNGVPYCDLSDGQHVCRHNPATVVTCPSSGDTLCATNTCDPATGACFMLDAPETTTCSDDDPCTSDDHCSDGECLGGSSICECRLDADCPNDGDQCNGTAYCDRSKLPWSCQINPRSVVTCTDGDPTDCVDRVCNPATGACEGRPLDDGDACADGDACTGDDACVAGTCVSGAPICGPNARCSLEAGGLATCVCNHGWGPPGVCDTPASADPCGGAPAAGQCNGEVLEYCDDGLLMTVPCHDLEYQDAEGNTLTQGGACLDLAAGARCVFREGQHCATTTGHEAWGCGDAGGLDPDMGCDPLIGCTLGLGSCDPQDPTYEPPPRCAGTVRVHACSDLAQALGTDCAHPLVGDGECVDGACVNLGEGAVCIPGSFECAADLECARENASAPTGVCTPPEAPPSATPCMVPPAWLGDGYCDEQANNTGCGWDGGDCCATTCVAGGDYACGSAGYSCQDPAAPPSGPGGDCAAPGEWVADGYCDALANNAACGWDGGDCCVSTCEEATYACGAAGFDCHDPDAPPGDPGSACAAPSEWVHDGYCDTVANNADCGWDGGDCCVGTCEDASYVCGTAGFECQDPDGGGDPSPPAEWTCDAAWYDAVDGCDCECGAYDPDCEIDGAQLFRCPVTATGCASDGTCVVPEDPPPDDPVDAGPADADAGADPPPEPDAGVDAPREPDAGVAEPREPDAGAAPPREPDAGPAESPETPEAPVPGQPGDEPSADERTSGCATAPGTPLSVVVAVLALLVARRRTRRAASTTARATPAARE